MSKTLNTGLKKLHHRMTQQRTLLCVGLDSEVSKLPERFQKSSTPQLDFNTWIIDQTHQFVAAYKCNLAFYESQGAQGLKELKETLEYLRTNHPDIFLVADAKRGDIGNTNDAYVTAIFDELGFDAVTLHPYLGKESLEPFLARQDKVSIILCRTSNPGAGEIQDLVVDGQPLWQVVAQKVRDDWNTNKNCMLVVGATYPDELKAIRKLVGDKLDFLVPGIGSQGGEVGAALKAGLNSEKRGLLITASRSVIFATDPGQAAQELFQEINDSR